MASSRSFPLTGPVEVDETYIGGSRPGKRGRGAEGKSLVAAAVETTASSMGRAYLENVNDASLDSLKSFIFSYVQPGVTVTSDGFNSYAFLDREFVHHPVIRNRDSDAAVLPNVHIVIANLKMWLRGTYNCPPSKHLQKYLDEFTFRFNRRWRLENIFDKLLDRCIRARPCTYAELIA